VKLINKRRDDSDSYTCAMKPGNEWAKESDPWHKWPVEMAIKTAMHYSVSRGWCVIDDTSSVRALANDVTTIDAVSVTPHPRIAPASSLDDLTSRLTEEPTPGADVSEPDKSEVTTAETDDTSQLTDVEPEGEQPFTGTVNDYLADVGMASDDGELSTIYEGAKAALTPAEFAKVADAIATRGQELT